MNKETLTWKGSCHGPTTNLNSHLSLHVIIIIVVIVVIKREAKCFIIIITCRLFPMLARPSIPSHAVQKMNSFLFN